MVGIQSQLVYSDWFSEQNSSMNGFKLVTKNLVNV